MPTCSNCGNHVTTAFVRVFGADNTDVHGCPSCMTFSDISDGEATDEDDEEENDL